MIRLSAVTKTYAEQQVLKSVDLDIRQGEIFGIIGQSGAGKSTLLRCINLLEKPDSGSVYIDQQDICQLEGDALRLARLQTAMIFQHFNLLQSRTVFENIALAMKIQGFEQEAIESKVEELLELVRLKDKAHQYPSNLSGGQKQRVAIARALSCSPKILLCDEATSAIDPKTREAILALLKKINQTLGITIVLITHEMDVIKSICHRLAVMESGRIIETTSLSEALNQSDTHASQLLFASIKPRLPNYLAECLSDEVSNRPVLRLYFKGAEASTPFISQSSRALNIDINILLANIDSFDNVTCGVLVVEIKADLAQFDAFRAACTNAGIPLEILGYV